MQINNNQNSPNFTAIKVIKGSPQEFLDFIKRFPEYTKNKIVFRAESKYHSDFYESLRKLAKKENKSLRWAYQNAENYNLVKISEMESLPTISISGKDKFRLKLWSIKNFFKGIKSGMDAQIECMNERLPAHLLEAAAVKNLADNTLESFNKFLKKNNAIETTFDELTKSMKKKS